jgi:uncharacterized membrane protein
MVGKAGKSTGYLILLILICLIVGSFIGDILQPYIPKLLSKSFTVGAGPLPINLKFMSITFGFTLNMNLFSVLGLITALIIYRKG